MRGFLDIIAFTAPLSGELIDGFVDQRPEPYAEVDGDGVHDSEARNLLVPVNDNL